jgi:hypothetical protein
MQVVVAESESEDEVNPFALHFPYSAQVPQQQVEEYDSRAGDFDFNTKLSFESVQHLEPQSEMHAMNNSEYKSFVARIGNEATSRWSYRDDGQTVKEKSFADVLPKFELLISELPKWMALYSLLFSETDNDGTSDLVDMYEDLTTRFKDSWRIILIAIAYQTGLCKYLNLSRSNVYDYLSLPANASISEMTLDELVDTVKGYTLENHVFDWSRFTDNPNEYIYPKSFNSGDDAEKYGDYNEEYSHLRKNEDDAQRDHDSKFLKLLTV